MPSLVAARHDTVARAETLAYAGLLLTSCAWAAAFIAGKVVLREMTPNVAATWRYAVAAVALLPWVWSQRPPLAVLRPVAVPLAVMVVCGGVLYQSIFLLALQRTTATNTSLLIALNPVFTLLLGTIIGERIDVRCLRGVLLALVGAAIVITHGDWQQASAFAHLSFSSGDVLAITAALCWACFNVASHRVVHVLSASFTNGLVYGIGALALALVSWNEHPGAQLLAASSAAYAGIAVMGIGSSVVAGQLFLFGIRTVGVQRTVVFIYLVPMLTALSSVVLLGESLYVAQAVGGAAVLGGVYWTNRRRTPLAA